MAFLIFESLRFWGAKLQSFFRNVFQCHIFRSFFLPFVTSVLVSNPFSRQVQELPLVALPLPEKVVLYLQRLFTAIRARELFL
jgi:hypothetical protein